MCIGDSTNRLASKKVNQRSNRPNRCAGVVAAACTQGKRTQHGKLRGGVSDDRPDAREGQAGRPGPHRYASSRTRPVAISHTAPTSFMRPSAIRARPSGVSRS